MRIPCRPMTVLVIGLGVAGCVAGCGASSLSKTIDEDKLKEMSRQGHIWVFDAENEIVVAMDRLDEAKDDLADLRRRQKEAEKRLQAAEKRNSRLGAEMAETWIAHLEKLEEWAEALIEAHQTGIVVAEATVELAKAQVINREDLVGGKGFAVNDYQDQYAQLKKEYDEQLKQAQKKRKAARKLEEKWWQLRQRFVAQTGDYDSGLWID